MVEGLRSLKSLTLLTWVWALMPNSKHLWSVGYDCLGTNTPQKEKFNCLIHLQRKWKAESTMESTNHWQINFKFSLFDFWGNKNNLVWNCFHSLSTWINNYWLLLNTPFLTHLGLLFHLWTSDQQKNIDFVRDHPMNILAKFQLAKWFREERCGR